jgi:hypothetical protein
MGPRPGQSASGMCSGALLWRLLAEHLGNLPPKDFTAPLTWLTSCVRVLTNASRERDDGQMSLGVLTPVFEGVQEPRIHSRRASQILKASISSVFRLLWSR